MHSFFLIDELTDQEGVPVQYQIDSGDQSNATVIRLNGRADAQLNWKEPRLQALKAIGQGLKILWQIDLGLFSELYAPLTDKMQYLTLGLSLNHFRDSLWPEFRDQTLGLCLYRGSLAFHSQLNWDIERLQAFKEWLLDHKLEVSKQNEERLHMLYSRDVALEYLNLLSNQFPDGLQPFLILDGSSIKEELLLAQLLSKDRYPNLFRLINIKRLSPAHFCTSKVLTTLGQNSFEGKLLQTATSGICLPEAGILNDAEYNHLQSLLNQLTKKGMAFRFVHEATLTSEWDGLNELITFSRAISPEGQRKLKGFSAAGGIVTFIKE